MNFFKSLVQKLAGKPVDWDELEESLIRSDIGVPMTMRIVSVLQERAVSSKITANDVVEVARDEIARVLPLAPPPIQDERVMKAPSPATPSTPATNIK